jgi:protein-S-isoprenylcysteine O-methyltransferase Ste14
LRAGVSRVFRNSGYAKLGRDYLGLLILFGSAAAAPRFQLRRMHNGEAVLTEIFPEYAAYRQRTTRLVPGIY